MYHGADVLVLWDVNRLLPIGSFKSFYPLCVVACLTKDFIGVFQGFELFFTWFRNSAFFFSYRTVGIDTPSLCAVNQRLYPVKRDDLSIRFTPLRHGIKAHRCIYRFSNAARFSPRASAIHRRH